jgi:hypothetical protein
MSAVEQRNHSSLAVNNCQSVSVAVNDSCSLAMQIGALVSTCLTGGQIGATDGAADRRPKVLLLAAADKRPRLLLLTRDQFYCY